jgi:hypothetical protein
MDALKQDENGQLYMTSNKPDGVQRTVPCTPIKQHYINNGDFMRARISSEYTMANGDEIKT